jgi:hypothetical protein
MNLVEDVLWSCLTDGTYRQQQCFIAIMSRCTPDVQSKSICGKPLLVAACENSLLTEQICLMLMNRDADINAIDKVQ